MNDKTPRKPYPSFPLTPRKDGRFAKKVKGQYLTFGSGGNWQTALDEYHRVAADVHAGREPPTTIPDIVTVKQCADRYLDIRRKEAEIGTIKWASWDDYREALARFARFTGRDLRIAQLRPDDFTRYSHHLTTTAKLGAHAFNRNRACIRAWLSYSTKAEWINHVNIGVGFNKVPAGKIRAQRTPKLFTPAEVRTLIKLAKPPLKAMILLGINGGLGNTDVASLKRDHVDLKARILRYPRTKNHIPRTVTLWPETVKALTKALKFRPHDPLVFRTRHGQLWVREVLKGKKVITKDSVGMQFKKLLATLERHELAGISFYTLRHTFATYANEVRDSDARLHLMGRKLPGIDGDAYIESVFVPRLTAMTNHVRSRILGKRHT